MTEQELDVTVARIIGRELRWIPPAKEDLGEFTANREWFDNGWLDVEKNLPVAKYSESADAALEAYAEFHERDGRIWWFDSKHTGPKSYFVSLTWGRDSVSAFGSCFAEALCRAIVATDAEENRK